MNSRGFAVVPVIIGCVVLGVIALLGFNQLSRMNQAHQIENEITSINLPYTLISKQCNAGDGVDSGAQCRFTYSDSGAGVFQGLKSAGYSSGTNDPQHEQGAIIATLRGGNPAVMIVLNGYNGKTVLDVTKNN